MKKLIPIILFLLVFSAAKIYAQVEPRISLKGWYNVVGVDVNLGFGATQKHMLEAGVISFGGANGYYAVELLYHYQLAEQGNGSLLAGLGARTFSFDDPDISIALPLTYRYRFPEQPFVIRARLTLLHDRLGTFAEPALGVSYIF